MKEEQIEVNPRDLAARQYQDNMDAAFGIGVFHEDAFKAGWDACAAAMASNASIDIDELEPVKKTVVHHGMNYGKVYQGQVALLNFIAENLSKLGKNQKLEINLISKATDLTEAQAKLQTANELILVLENELGSIREYWNGGEPAALDAIQHAESTAIEALNKIAAFKRYSSTQTSEKD